jgi:hypothetical protein
LNAHKIIEACDLRTKGSEHPLQEPALKGGFVVIGVEVRQGIKLSVRRWPATSEERRFAVWAL